ncbi:hypothetical protein NUM3379_26670 [Kineococcus sp. NUM-3379]
MNDTDVKDLLASAARTAVPRESDPVGAVLRRRTAARRRATAWAVCGTAAACAVLAVAGSLPGGSAVRPDRLPPATRTAEPAPPWTPAPPAVTERGINGVEVTAAGYEAVRRDEAELCPAPGTVVVSVVPGGRGWCEEGHGAVVQPLARRDWQTGYPAEPGMQLRSGVPLWFTDGPPARFGVGVATLTLPTRGVSVVVTGTAEQRRELLDSVTVAPDPGERDAPVLATGEPLTFGRLTDGPGNGDGGDSADPELLRRIAEAVDGAPRLEGEPGCVPAHADFVQVDLQTSPDSDPATAPVGGYTYLAADITGRCDLVFSSTGAVVRPDPAGFRELLRRLQGSRACPDCGR